MTLNPSDYFTGEPLTRSMVRDAEQALGVELPADYLADLLQCNGGVPDEVFFATSYPTTWSKQGFEISAVLGVGGELGIETPDGGALYLADEWGYPAGCIAFCLTPAAGPDTVLFDYRECGPLGSPKVVYYDCDNADPGPYPVADSYTEFLNGLGPRPTV